MPERRQGEPLNKLVARFIQNKREQKQFHDLKQRLADDYAESRKAKK